MIVKLCRKDQQQILKILSLNLASKKRVTYAKISPKMVNPTDIAGNTEEEELDFMFQSNQTAFQNLV